MTSKPNVTRNSRMAAIAVSMNAMVPILNVSSKTDFSLVTSAIDMELIFATFPRDS